MELHTRQSLEAIHRNRADDTAAGVAPWQDIAEDLRLFGAAGRWLLIRLQQATGRLA